MARRNIFQPPSQPVAETAVPDEKPRFPNTGTMSGVKSTLKELSSNAVREIAPDLIEEEGPKDRLSFSDDDVAKLAESIREHGQQVPIMIRPLPGQTGRYRIVYGRRRLRALRLLGTHAKALIRSLSDEEAVLAQGQENSQRLDPSFIEKALFAAELTNGDYEPSVVTDALAIDKPMLSRMLKVTRSIPSKVIHLIGPAHGIGRRRWEELADLVRNHDINLAGVANEHDVAKLSSDQRFAKISEAAKASLAKQSRAAPSDPPALLIAHKDGTVLGEVKETSRSFTIKMSKSDAPDFTRWLQDNAETELLRLYEAWQQTAPTDT